MLVYNIKCDILACRNLFLRSLMDGHARRVIGKGMQMEDYLVDILPLISGAQNEITFAFSFTLEADFPGAAFQSPFSVSGKVRSMDGYMEMEAHADGKYKTFCDRCAIELERELSVAITKPVVRPGDLTEDADPDDYIVAEGKSIDVGREIEEELILSFPTKHLCREDCLGLCQRCGKDLNEGPCGCVTKEINPIWEKIRKDFE